MNIKKMYKMGRYREIVERYDESIDPVDEETKRYVLSSIDIDSGLIYTRKRNDRRSNKSRCVFYS